LHTYEGEPIFKVSVNFPVSNREKKKVIFKLV